MLIGFLNRGSLWFTPFCWEQAKHSRCHFSCWAYAFMSFRWAHNNICNFYKCNNDIVVCPAEGRELTRHSAGNSSFCQTHTLKVLTPTSTYRQFIICMSYLLKFHTKQDLSSNIISCKFIYNANRIFKLW